MRHHYNGKDEKTHPLKTKGKFEVFAYVASEFAFLSYNFKNSDKSGQLDKFVQLSYASHS